MAPTVKCKPRGGSPRPPSSAKPSKNNDALLDSDDDRSSPPQRSPNPIVFSALTTLAQEYYPAAPPTSTVVRTMLEAAAPKMQNATRAKLQSMTPEEAIHRWATQMSIIWQDSTLGQRASLFQQFQVWSTIHGLPTEENWSADLFVAGLPKAKASSQHQYLKELSLILSMIRNNNTTRLLIKSFASNGGLIAQNQAPPMTKAQMLTFAAKHPSQKLPLYLAWKAVLRWDDVKTNLTIANFLKITASEIVIDFGEKSKTGRHQPYTPSRFVVIEGDLTKEIAQMLSQYTSSVKKVRILRKDPRPGSKTSTASNTFTTWTTSKFEQELSKIFPNQGLRAHSPKAGALAHLMNNVPADEMDLKIFEIVAKHNTKYDKKINPTTVRYLCRPKQAEGKLAMISLARQLGTQKLTKYL